MRSPVPPYDGQVRTRIETQQEGEKITDLFYYDIPDSCPVCNMGIDARIIFAHRKNDYSDIAQVVFQCPRDNCHSLFIGYFTGNYTDYHFRRAEPVIIEAPEFSDEIRSISESFVTIYSEAFEAEKRGLSQICGVGYRKALEFLIKDYVIHNTSDDSTRDQIKSMWLTTVIKDHISSERIKSVAEKAAWLGNDETHYYRVFTDMNVDDLKTLIDLTVLWIEMEFKEQSYDKKMSSRE